MFNSMKLCKSDISKKNRRGDPLKVPELGDYR